MNARPKLAAVLIVLALLASVAPSPAQETAPNPAAVKLERLRSQIERLIRNEDGKVGVAVKHLESGQGLAFNGDEPFPMASTFKLPVLVELLYQVKEGRYGLEDPLVVQESEKHVGSGLIAKMATPGITLSVRNMAHFMMMISDNSAADILLEKVGADNVNARLKGLGIEGISVNRSCQKLIGDSQALRADAKTFEETRAAIIKFGEDPQDRATPAAMTSLLERIFKREILDPESCDLILRIMLQCETGAGRIRGSLPRGTAVAHKTGTLAGTIDDVGIVYLPDGAGHVAISILTKGFTDDSADVEKILAEIGRFVFDCFYFTM